MSGEARLTILFTGSCGFVPNIEQTRVRVLLPRGEDGSVAVNDNRIVVPPHRSFIKLAMKYLHPQSERKPDLVYVDGRDQVGIFLLNRETLTLPDSPDDLDFSNNPIDTLMGPESGEKRSLRWAANMGEFCDQLSLREEFLGAERPDSLAAMLDISAGTIDVEFISTDTFEFSPPADTPPAQEGDYPRPLAGEVAVSSRVDAEEAVIRSDQPGGSLRVQPVDGEIRLEITNEVLDDVIIGSHARRLSTKDFDFELLYELTNAQRADGGHWHIPTRVGSLRLEVKGKGDCIPIIFPRSRFPLQS